MKTFLEWLKDKKIKEASIVFGNSQKKKDLGPDAQIWGAPGVTHGQTKGPIMRKSKKK